MGRPWTCPGTRRGQKHRPKREYRGWVGTHIASPIPQVGRRGATGLAPAAAALELCAEVLDLELEAEVLLLELAVPRVVFRVLHGVLELSEGLLELRIN